MYDLIIIGASAAGLSAGIYAARRNLNFIILSKDIGGEVATSGEIENWPGIIHTDGIALARQFHEHAKSYGITIHDQHDVTAIVQKNNAHVVETVDGNGEKKSYETKSAIIASGIHPKSLNLPGEKELKGRGITS
ncbi:MAG: NAD(P)/FAD-dependent oxidoreductase, partial [Patescibacteria group bacterium]